MFYRESFADGRGAVIGMRRSSNSESYNLFDGTAADVNNEDWIE